jgi:glycosyltransferase involved in cell wall biosynthesis
MNILQVIPVFDPPKFYCGSQQVAYQISRELVKRGHNVTVYSSDLRSDLRTRLERQVEEIDGIRVVHFKCSNPVLAENIKFVITPSMREGLLKESPDVIHLHEARSYQHILVNRLSKKENFPYIVQAHGILEGAGGFTRWFYDFKYGDRILREAAKLIALNLQEEDAYRHAGVREDNIAILPNGIDMSEYVGLPPKGSFKRKFGIIEEKKVILYLGRINKTKGIDLLVKAYSKLVRDMELSKTMLVIAGPDDGYLSKVKSLANSLHISDSVFFSGYLSDEDKIKAYVDADVFVTPSFIGFPITFLEACAIGTPIVTTTLGDNLEWIDGRTGYVVKPKDQDLAQAIFKITSNSDLREEFSKNCIEIAKEFSIQRVVQRLEKIYGDVARS